MIYNNGTVSVHKSYINSLLFAATRSGLVEDGLKAKGMIRESKNEARQRIQRNKNRSRARRS